MAFLHFNPLHLILNCLALFVAGRRLEPLIGQQWFIALFVFGAIGASLASAIFNAPGLVACGASGGIMALCGFMSGVALRNFDEATTKRLTIDSAFLLTATLTPLFFSAGTNDGPIRIDHAAHVGGAVTGLIIAALSVSIWPNVLEPPRHRSFAKAICTIAFLVITLGIVSLAIGNEEYRQAAEMIPELQFPADPADRQTYSQAFVARYPNDARSHFYRALDLIQREDLEKAEQSARQAIAIVEKYPRLYDNDFRWRPRFVQAITLSFLNRLEEARTVGASLCDLKLPDDSMSRLKLRGICKG